MEEKVPTTSSVYAEALARTRLPLVGMEPHLSSASQQKQVLTRNRNATSICKHHATNLVYWALGKVGSCLLVAYSCNLRCQACLRSNSVRIQVPFKYKIENRFKWSLTNHLKKSLASYLRLVQRSPCMSWSVAWIRNSYLDAPTPVDPALPCFGIAA